MNARHWLAIVMALALVSTASAAGAGQWPHERQGLVLGFGIGGGSGQVSWSDGGFSEASDREGGFGGNVRVGYAFSPELMLGFEGASWTRTFTNEGGLDFPDVDETWTLSASTVALTWFPNGGGFFLRGGIGGGTTEVKFTRGDLEVKGHDSGFGGLLAFGYEWRLTRRFAMGPELTFGGMTLDDGWKANFTNLTLGFNWYL